MRHRNLCALFVASVILLSFCAMPDMASKASADISLFALIDVSRNSLTNDNAESECEFTKIRTSPFSLKKGKADIFIPYSEAHHLLQSAFSITLKNADSPMDKLIKSINSRAP